MRAAIAQRAGPPLVLDRAVLPGGDLAGLDAARVRRGRTDAVVFRGDGLGRVAAALARIRRRSRCSAPIQAAAGRPTAGAAPNPVRARLSVYHPALRAAGDAADQRDRSAGLAAALRSGAAELAADQRRRPARRSGVGTLVVTIGLAFVVWEAVNIAIQRASGKAAAGGAGGALGAAADPAAADPHHAGDHRRRGRRADGAERDRRQHRPAAGRRRDRRRGDRLRLAEAGAGRHHRRVPAAGEHHAGRRRGAGRRSVRAWWKACRCGRSGCAPRTARSWSSRSAR